MRTFLILVICLVWQLSGAVAQESRPTLPDLQSLVQQHELIVSAAQASTQDRNADAELAASRQALEELQNEIEPALRELREERLSIDKEIEQLGPLPSDGAPAETKEITQRRQSLVERRSKAVLALQDYNKLNEVVESSISEIVEIRRSLFANALLVRTPLSVIDVRNTIDRYLKDLKTLVRTGKFQLLQLENLLSLLVLLTLYSVITYLVNKIIRHRLGLHTVSERDTFFRKVGNACLRILINTYAPVLGVVLMGVAYLKLYEINYSLESLSILLAILGATCFSISTIRVVARISEASGTGPSGKPIRALSVALQSLIFVLGLDYFSQYLLKRNSLLFQVEVTQSFVISTILGIHFAWIAILVFRLSNKSENFPGYIHRAGQILLISGFFVLISNVTGFVSLAYFLSQKVVLSGILFGVLLIVFNTGRSIGHEGNLIETPLGRTLIKKLHFSHENIDRIGYLAGLLLSLVSALMAIPILLLIWSFKVEDIVFWGQQFVEGINVGSVKVSPFSLVKASVIFFSIIFLSQYLRSWVDRKVMARSKADSGVKDSIKTGIRYIGIALAVVFASMTLGIDFSSLAIVAGALSIGIGFGLQNIVSNFVSGLILLIERPIKVGDWVETSTISGFVKNISVRATEVETFNQQSIIVPNSEFINNQVGNWTHKNRRGRLVIPIGVGYSSDSRAVAKFLKLVAENEPMVLAYPEPQVAFVGFGASSLDFELKVYIADIINKPSIETELRHAILDILRNENIEIPYPKIDLQLPQSNDVVQKTTENTN